MNKKAAEDDPRCYLRGDHLLSEIAEAHGMSPDAASALASIDEVMNHIRRSIMKRDFGRKVLRLLDSDLEVVHMDVLAAVGHENPDAPAGEEITVGLVAERLAIDPSRASRLVADVVERGYVRRVASQADSRRICLELTGKGRAFVQAVRETKWRVFSASLAKWDETELITFARLLDRFSNWTAEVPLDENTESPEPLSRIPATVE
jgi:DNA-binding MarR family transcriptional regulator